jgi:hypothetical protein
MFDSAAKLPGYIIFVSSVIGFPKLLLAVLIWLSSTHLTGTPIPAMGEANLLQRDENQVGGKGASLVFFTNDSSFCATTVARIY